LSRDEMTHDEKSPNQRKKVGSNTLQAKLEEAQPNS